MSVFGHLRRLSPATRRFAALALLVLQGALVLAPMWEPASTVTPVTHIEESGARHLDVHDDATCAVCQWRLLDSAPSAPAYLLHAGVHQHAAPAGVFELGRGRDLAPGKRTRAPPQLG
ncbi:MAG: hypothetical protein HYR75_05610 [Gemmatimonadetes bacterium]|nr:hypothetical protein [Gemmatimonadota bacterium]